MKLVVDEAESAALVTFLRAGPRRVVASWLLHAELHCGAGRHPRDLTIDAVAGVLDVVDLVDLTRGDLLAAGAHAPLRSHDAIHLATALRVGADEMVTYDAELAASATAVGLRVHAPE